MPPSEGEKMASRSHEVFAGTLESRTRSKEWPPGGLMPPIRWLSAEFGVSPPTVLKALALLCERQVLEHSVRDRRYRIFGFSGSAKNAEHLESGPRYRRVARRMRSDLTEGIWSEELPLAKELRARYACSHPTLRKVLHELESEGLIMEDRGRWRVSTQSAVMGMGSRVYITGGRGLLHAYHHRTLTLLTGIERGLQRYGWGRPEYYCTDKPEWKSAPQLHQVSGFVHLMLGSNKAWLRFHKRHPELPLVLLDLQESMRGKFVHKVLFRIMPDNRRAGMEVGRHLREEGHSDVALLSHITIEQQWVRKRALGLADAFGVEEVLEDGPIKWFGVEEHNKTPSSSSLKAAAALRSHIRSIYALTLSSGLLPAELIRDDMEAAYRLTSHLFVSQSAQSLFSAALKEKAVTAWICVNDDLAAMAHHFLISQGIAPGRDIALCGFDNAPVSRHLGITSYDFTYDRMGPEAVRCLRYPAQVEREGTVRVMPGQLVMRNSSMIGKAPATVPQATSAKHPPK